MPPQDDSPRRSNQERTQIATDEMVFLFRHTAFAKSMTLTSARSWNGSRSGCANEYYFFRIQVSVLAAVAYLFNVPS
jgi:hypothetical protein